MLSRLPREKHVGEMFRRKPGRMSSSLGKHFFSKKQKHPGKKEIHWLHYTINKRILTRVCNGLPQAMKGDRRRGRDRGDWKKGQMKRGAQTWPASARQDELMCQGSMCVSGNRKAGQQ